MLRQLLGCPTASPLASSPSDQVSPSLFKSDLSASTSLKLSFVKSCGATSCAASWVPWWRMLIKEKRLVEFVIASAKQKQGSLSAGFLCRGRLQSGEHCGVDVASWRGCFSEGRVTRGRLVLCLPRACHTSAAVTGQDVLIAGAFRGLFTFSGQHIRGTCSTEPLSYLTLSFVRRTIALVG